MAGEQRQRDRAEREQHASRDEGATQRRREQRADARSSTASDALSRKNRSASDDELRAGHRRGRDRQPARVAGADGRGEQRPERGRGEDELHERERRVPRGPRRHAVDARARGDAADAERDGQRAERRRRRAAAARAPPAYSAGDRRERREEQHFAAQPRAPPHLQRAIGVDRPAEVQRRRRQRQRRRPAATSSAATPSRVDAPSSCSSQIVANAPTESCVSTVMTTSGQCGSRRRRRATRSTGRAFGGRSAGSVMRVVERLLIADGQPGAGARRPRPRATRRSLTISIWIAPFGTGADTHAGACPSVEPAVAHVALADHAALGVVLRHAVRAVPRAVLAADAGVGAVQHDAGGRVLRVGVDRTAAQARRLDAVVAAHREVRALRVRDTSRLRSRRRAAS